MPIVKIEFSEITPLNDASWTKLVNTDKFQNLDVSDPVNYDFSSNTIKKGVQINIGGSNYQATSDTLITGTPSIYVKVVLSTLVPEYVANLSGVTWNDTYNFYADVSGNAYIIDEPQAVFLGTITTPKTKVGKFAEHGYFKEISVSGDITQTSGVTSLKATTIRQIANTVSDGLTVYNTSTFSGKFWVDTDKNVRIDGRPTGVESVVINGVGDGPLLVNTLVANSIDAIQTPGSIYAGGGVKTDNARMFQKKVELPVWDMDADSSKSVSHGLTVGKIRRVTAKVKDDTLAVLYNIEYQNQGSIVTNATNVIVTREDSGFFDSTDFDSEFGARGEILIDYEA